MEYREATDRDIPFIAEVYTQNIKALHGVYRSYDDWKSLLSIPGSAYYIVSADIPVAWFRVDYCAADTVELGMLQVMPSCQRRGAGKYIIAIVEALAARQEIERVIIHTTEDNYAAQALYTASGYPLVEIGPCTTADGQERVGYTYQKSLV